MLKTKGISEFDSRIIWNLITDEMKYTD